jgi:hypothetical protein
MACLCLALAACSSGGSSALDEARAACKAYLPAVDGPAVTSEAEAQNGLAKAKAALAHAAKAARKDSRWNALNKADSAMVDTWAYDVAVIQPAGLNDDGTLALSGPEQQTYKGLYDGFVSAASTARAECAKARA